MSLPAYAEDFLHAHFPDEPFQFLIILHASGRNVGDRNETGILYQLHSVNRVLMRMARKLRDEDL